MRRPSHDRLFLAVILLLVPFPAMEARKAACLLVPLDGFNGCEGIVLDNLIAKKELPVMIAVSVGSGRIWADPPDVPTAKRRASRFNRSYEFDSVERTPADHLLHELLPAIEKLKAHDGRPSTFQPTAAKVMPSPARLLPGQLCRALIIFPLFGVIRRFRSCV
jgi:hypothetical protein